MFVLLPKESIFKAGKERKMLLEHPTMRTKKK
jgi:hypothetical protein